jgi:hypothetical protein
VCCNEHDPWLERRSYTADGFQHVVSSLCLSDSTLTSLWCACALRVLIRSLVEVKVVGLSSWFVEAVALAVAVVWGQSTPRATPKDSCLPTCFFFCAQELVRLHWAQRYGAPRHCFRHGTSCIPPPVGLRWCQAVPLLGHAISQVDACCDALEHRGRGRVCQARLWPSWSASPRTHT